MKKELDRFEKISLIILVIVLFIVLLVLVLNNPESDRIIQPCKTFHVTLSKESNKQKYIIDGEITPTLHLKRGKRYRFVINTPNHPIYLTTDPHGGEGLPGNFLNDKNGVTSLDERGLAENGDFDILLSRDVEIGTLYYQSTKEQDVGGKIILQ